MAVNETVAERDQFLVKIEVALMATMFTTAVIGNTLALMALALRRRKLSRMHYFILHLCIADLVVAFFHILPQMLLDITGKFIGGYPGDNVLCKIVKYLQLFGMYISSYVLVVTAIDRYQAICFPLMNCSWTAKRSKIMIVIAWIISLLLSVPQMFIFSYMLDSSNGDMDCLTTFMAVWGPQIYVLWNAITVFIIPLLVLIFTYSCICHAIWINFQQKNPSPKSNQRGGFTTTTKSLQQLNNSSNIVVGGSYRFRGKGKVELTLKSDGAKDGSSSERSNSSIHPRAHSLGGISRAKMKTIKLTVVVILCYVTCSLPYFSSILYVTWYPGGDPSFATSYAYTILALLASLNSCVNPWIYLIFNENLAKTLKDLFCCRLYGDTQQGFGGATAVSRSSLSETKSGTYRTHNNVIDKTLEKPKLSNTTNNKEVNDFNMNGHHKSDNIVHSILGDSKGESTQRRPKQDNQENNGHLNGATSSDMPKEHSSGEVNSLLLAETTKDEQVETKSGSMPKCVKIKVKNTLESVCRPSQHKWKQIPMNCYGNCKDNCNCDVV